MKSADIVLHYGDRVLSGFIPQSWINRGGYLPLVAPRGNPPVEDRAAALARALENPVGDAPSFGEMVKRCFRGGTVSVLVDDHTRPNTHTRLLLPLLRERLCGAYGIPVENIVIVVCAGTHRRPTGGEWEKILGAEAHAGLRVVVHDCKGDLEEIGRIEGVPVKFNRTVLDSDIVIPLTDVDNHYFAGVAGGPKAFCPGVAGEEIVTWEHLHMFNDSGFAENVALGVLEGNPVYKCKKRIVGAALDALKKRGSGVYCITAIMDPEGNLVYLEGGETFAAHRAAAEMLRGVWTVRIRERAEIVIAGASNSGINLYQAGKAIHAAYHAVRRGGFILAVAPCTEGFGNDEYRKLMRLASNVLNKYPDGASGMREAALAVLAAVKKNFRIGKQKAVDLFRILEFVGWGHLHMIQDGLGEEDRKLLPLVLWGTRDHPVEDRLVTWIERHAQGKTITVIDNPGYLVTEE